MSALVESLDVSDLEAPEPLVRTLEALERLPRGHCLRMIHRMKPCLLYEHLSEQGFESDTREGRDGRCEVFVWRRGDRDAREAARWVAGDLPSWRD